MKLKKVHVAGLAGVLVAAGAVGFGVSASGTGTTPDPGRLVVDWSIPHHELLDDVLAIEERRDSGSFSFSYMPKVRPTGLARLLPGVEGSTVVDGYHLGGRPVQVFVEFAGQPTGTCADVAGDPGAGLCLQERPLAAAVADDTRMRHVTVYLSQVGISAPVADDPATAEIRAFWSGAELVPAADAKWYTELVAEAEAAPRRKLG
jgi:hypothetical protein